MLYYSTLVQERFQDELWIRKGEDLYPIFDYKIDNNGQIRLISNPGSSVVDAVGLEELTEYVVDEGTPLVPYVIVDEMTGQYLDIKDRFCGKIIFEICN